MTAKRLTGARNRYFSKKSVRDYLGILKIYYSCTLDLDACIERDLIIKWANAVLKLQSRIIDR